MLRVEVLGFAGAAPLQGGCSSYLVSDANTTVLLDCGPGTLERLWRRGLVGELDAIVISHMHADHVLDLMLYAGEVVRELIGDRCIALFVPAVAGRDVLGRLDAVFAREAATSTRFDATFAISEYGASSRLAVGALELTFAATEHAQPCFAARVSDGESVIVYGADGSPSPALVSLAHGADLVILEATFLDDDAGAARHGHMTAAQAGAVAAQAGAARLLLTHTLAGALDGQLVERASRSFGGPVEVAREGYVYPVS